MAPHHHVAEDHDAPDGVDLGSSAEVVRLVAEIEKLRRAMESRAVIELAKGMLAERRGCTPDEAFQALVAQSQETNRKVRDIAADLVEAGPQRR